MRSAVLGASLLAVLVSVWAADAYDDGDSPHQVLNLHAQITKFPVEGDIFAGMFVLPSALAQVIITVETAKDSYIEGEDITVSGRVSPVLDDTPVLLNILLDGRIIEVAQVTPAQNGTYAERFATNNSNWNMDGTYTIKAYYGEGNSVETEFEFVTVTQSITDIWVVDVGVHGTMDVGYTISGGQITDMRIDPEQVSLFTTLTTTRDGFVTMDIERRLIDSTEGGSNSSFIVLIDNTQVPHTELASDGDTRRIEIRFSEGDTNIQIIGTETIFTSPPDIRINTGPVIAPVSNTAINRVLEAYMSRGLVAFTGVFSDIEDAVGTIPVGSGFGGFLLAGIMINGTDTGLPGAELANYDITGPDDITVFISELGNVPPILSPIGNYTINAHERLGFDVTAMDFGNDTVSYRLSGAPDGATMAGPALGPTIQRAPTDRGKLDVELSTVPTLPVPGTVILRFNFINPSTERIQQYIDWQLTIKKDGMRVNAFGSHSANGIVEIPITAEEGWYELDMRVSGILFQPIPEETASFGISVGQNVLVEILEGATITWGDFSWTPGFADVGNHAFTITAYDKHGYSDTKTVTIHVLPAETPNMPPTAPDTTVTVAPDDRVAIVPAIRDPDGDPVRITSATGSAGSRVTVRADQIEYFATSNAATETITYIVKDSHGACSTGAITASIQGAQMPGSVNTPIHTYSDLRLNDIGNMDINAQDTLEFTAVACDTDGDIPKYYLEREPAGATMNGASGEFVWTPTASQTGLHTFTIVATDGRLGYDDESITVRVFPAGTSNRPPTAPDSTVIVGRGLVTIMPAISDPDGDPVRIIGATGNAGGTIVSSDNGIEYTAASDVVTEMITYAVADAQGAASTGTITARIQGAPVPGTTNTPIPANAAPFLNTTANMGINAQDTLEFTAVAYDRDGDIPTYHLADQPAGATMNGASGEFVWTPVVSQTGSHTFTLIAADGHGNADLQTVTVRVFPERIARQSPDRTHGGTLTAYASPILGDPDAPITIVMFGDYQNWLDKSWVENIRPAISKNYIEPGKANLVYVDRALLGMDSMSAAQASYCAGDQGAYWEYHDSLYRGQGSVNSGWANNLQLKWINVFLGLDVNLFNACLDSEKYKDRVLANVIESNRRAVNTVPTFFITGPDGTETKIMNARSYDSFELVLESKARAIPPRATVSIPEGSGMSPDCAEDSRCFMPYQIMIDIGDKVRWVNNDQRIHNVSIGHPGGSGPENFDSGSMNPGDEFLKMFETPGTYNYTSTLYPWMMGVVHVLPRTNSSSAEVSITADAVNWQCRDRNTCLDQSTVTIDVGGKVTWTNNAGSPVTLLSGRSGDSDAGSLLRSGPIPTGATYTHLFKEIGRHSYFSLHQAYMRGTVIVTSEHHDDVPDAIRVTKDGYQVLVWIGAPTPGESLDIDIEVRDTDGDLVRHLNHDIVVTQYDTVVLDESGEYHLEGFGSYMTRPLDYEYPVDITFTLQGLGIGNIDTRIGPIGEEVVFTQIPR